MESITIPLEGPNELSFDQPVQLRAKIPRYGDLLSDMVFTFTIPDIYSKYLPPQSPVVLASAAVQVIDIDKQACDALAMLASWPARSTATAHSPGSALHVYLNIYLFILQQ